MALYRCQLERLGAPRWACAIGGVLLGLAAVVYLGVISVSLWNKPSTPRWILPLLWCLGALALALAARSAAAALRSGSESDVSEADRPSPSNNRWRGP
jgi:hypothetical protein